MKEFEPDAIIRQVRNRLDIRIIDFANSVEALPEGPSKEKMLNLRFCDIFNTASITNEDECLAELVKYIHKIDGMKIGDINKLIPQCDRTLLTKTLSDLDLAKGGGLNGYAVKTEGQRRGKKYKLIKKEE